jgi:hypothetical protein
MTPAAVHYGLAEECNLKRQEVLTKAFEMHPERFVRGCPHALNLPKEAWINKPAGCTEQGASILVASPATSTANVS